MALQVVRTSPIAVDGLLLLGEGRHQVVSELLLAVGEVDPLAVGEVKLVVGVAQGGPLELAVRQRVQHPTGLALAGHLAHRVDADVPEIAFAAEGVGEPTGDVVLLQDEDLLALLGQQGRAGHAAHAGADDDGVELLTFRRLTAPG